MGMHDDCRKVVKYRNEKLKENIQKSSKNRLKKIIEKKIMTTLIGSIALVEEYLGEFWGLGVPKEQLTKKEKQFLELWEELRQEMLDHGNHQKRAAMIEIEQYETKWNRYQNVLPVKGEGNDRNEQEGF